MANAGEVAIPRSFKLLMEYDASTGKLGKSFLTGSHAPFISYGWVECHDDPERIDMCNWSGVIIGIQGKHTGELLYNFTVFVPYDYPRVPPRVKFSAPKMAMSAVDNKGNVNLHQLSPSFTWRPTMNIADVLMAIRENMSDDTVCRESIKLANTSY